MTRLTKIVMTLDALAVVLIGIVATIQLTAKPAEQLASLGISGGAEGPTAAFISNESHPLDLMPPFGLLLLLLLNIATLWKSS